MRTKVSSCKVVYRQLLVLLCINERLIIQTQLDKKFRNTHTMILSKGFELNAVDVAEAGVQEVELKRDKHLHRHHVDSGLLDRQ